MTAAFAACHSLAAGAAVWAVNGLGLALVLPNTQVEGRCFQVPGLHHSCDSHRAVTEQGGSAALLC